MGSLSNTVQFIRTSQPALYKVYMNKAATKVKPTHRKNPLSVAHPGMGYRVSLNIKFVLCLETTHLFSEQAELGKQ